MKNVRPKVEHTDCFEDGPREETKTRAVVIVVEPFAGSAGELIDALPRCRVVALEELGLFDEVNGNVGSWQRRPPQSAFDDAVADRQAKAMLRLFERLLAETARAIEGHDDGGVDAACLERDGEGADDIGESAGLREPRHLRRR